VSWPGGGVTQNLESDLLLNQCDIFATLLDAANAGPPPPAVPSPGRSFLAQLRGTAAADWRDFIVSEYGNARMIRSGGHKLILRYPYQGVRLPNEFYDLKADPREVTNLYVEAAERHRAVIERMTAQLDNFFDTYTVPENSGLTLETQPMATPASPWLVKS
jgi:arylsulfatase A-like enzyme